MTLGSTGNPSGKVYESDSWLTRLSFQAREIYKTTPETCVPGNLISKGTGIPVWKNDILHVQERNNENAGVES
jgi:hypothetical protein